LASVSAEWYRERTAPTFAWQRETSGPLQRESADFPGRRPARKRSRVSPSGGLIDSPGMAMRSVLDKVDLHDREGADLLLLQRLPGADPGISVDIERLRENDDLIGGPQRREKSGVM